jgi:protein-tyrosine phosphatase
MAGALLARHLANAGQTAVRVRSAGLLRDGEEPPAEVVRVMAGYGVDVSRHRSHVVTSSELAAAGLVVAMARDQVRRAAVMVPGAWPRSFTLNELLRRGEDAGPRHPSEPLASWLQRLHAGRDRADLLGDSPDDDIADPFGGPAPGYAATAALLDQLLARLVRLALAG